MFRPPLAAAAVLGSAALATAALAGPSVAATPTAAAAPQPVAAAAPQPVAAPSAQVRAAQQGKHRVTRFDLVPSTGVVRAGCIPKAKATVKIVSGGEAETMKVWVSGLPAHTEFDFFVLQVPDFPFGLSWYQGDIETDRYGRGYAKFVGRFNAETFSVAPGVAPAPTPHGGDAASNPATRPVHQHHLGFWFNDPADAAKAGCGDLVTPFNGDHDAGTQAMSSRNFPVGAGPLGRIGS